MLDETIFSGGSTASLWEVTDARTSLRHKLHSIESMAHTKDVSVSYGEWRDCRSVCQPVRPTAGVVEHRVSLQDVVWSDRASDLYLEVSLCFGNGLQSDRA